MRHWNVYLYNHAHVDIGYTNTHKNVEQLHKNNIIEGIKLGRRDEEPSGGCPLCVEPRNWMAARTLMAIQSGDAG